MTLPAGPIISKAHVTAAVTATLQDWYGYYLAEACRAHGLAPDALPGPVSWQKLPDVRAANPDQYPAVIVTSPGLAGRPTMDGEGNVRMTWRVQAIVMVRGQSFDEVERDVGIHTSALRVCAVQQGVFGDLDATTTLSGELYDVIDPRSARTLGAGQVDLEVTVSDVMRAQVGPTGDAPADPHEEPAAASTAVTGTVLEEPLHPAFE